MIVKYGGEGGVKGFPSDFIICCYLSMLSFFCLLFLYFIAYLCSVSCFLASSDLAFPPGYLWLLLLLQMTNPAPGGKEIFPRLCLTQVFTIIRKEKTDLWEWVFFFTKLHFSLIMSKLWTCFLKYVLIIEASYDSKTIVVTNIKLEVGLQHRMFHLLIVCLSELWLRDILFICKP